MPRGDLEPFLALPCRTLLESPSLACLMAVFLALAEDGVGGKPRSGLGVAGIADEDAAGAESEAPPAGCSGAPGAGAGFSNAGATGTGCAAGCAAGMAA